MSAYTLLKFVHVLAAIVALGFNLSYGIWLSRASRRAELREQVLRGIDLVDHRVASPAYALLLITGVSIVLVGDLDFRTLWIASSLVLYFLSAALGVFGFTPTLRRQIAALESEGSDSPRFQELSGRVTLFFILSTLPMVIIVFLMVTKPTL